MPSHLRVAHGGHQNQRSMGVCHFHLPGSCPCQGCLCNCGHRLYTLFKTLDPGAVIASENMLTGTSALKLEKNFSRRNPYTYESILILSYLVLFNGFWERIFILFVMQSFVKNWRYLFLNSRKAFLSPQKMITAAGWSKGRGLKVQSRSCWNSAWDVRGLLLLVFKQIPLPSILSSLKWASIQNTVIEEVNLSGLLLAS